MNRPPATPEELLARAAKPAERAMHLHPFYRGKIQSMLKCPVRGPEDLAIWYTPGVAAPCREIQAHPETVYEHTNRANTVAVVSDGSRVLGLGDIGPEAGLPVMEGKALLFKYLGGIDAVPLCLRQDTPERLVETAAALEPSFGGINLEDIAQPKCFVVLDRLRERMAIPVWHDDQQGTATVTLAALLNTLAVTGKPVGNVRITLVGMGAANVAVYRLLVAFGIPSEAIIACDSRGILSRHRADIEADQDAFFDKWRVCLGSGGRDREGGTAEALAGADICIAFSAPGALQAEWIKGMAKNAAVFACANPVPEIWPWEAEAAGAAIVATGRGDFPNQLNNSLGFPGIFRGVLDIRARTISDGMAIAAARELAACAADEGLRSDAILPRMENPEAAARVAAAAGMQARAEGIARVEKSRDELHDGALAAIGAARAALDCLIGGGLIAMPPDD